MWKSLRVHVIGLACKEIVLVVRKDLWVSSEKLRMTGEEIKEVDKFKGMTEEKKSRYLR